MLIYSIYQPLRFRIVVTLSIFTLNTPTTSSSYAIIVQDAFARNPSVITQLAATINGNEGSIQVRTLAAKVLLSIAQVDWWSSRLTNAKSVVLELQTSVTRLVSAR